MWCPSRSERTVAGPASGLRQVPRQVPLRLQNMRFPGEGAVAVRLRNPPDWRPSLGCEVGRCTSARRCCRFVASVGASDSLALGSNSGGFLLLL